MPFGLFYLKSFDRSISNRKGFWLFLLLLCFKEIPVFNSNSVDPDQTPHSAASDLGLHCLPMSLLLDARLKWVDVENQGQTVATFTRYNNDIEWAVRVCVLTHCRLNELPHKDIRGS